MICTGAVIGMMTLVWAASVRLRDASIIDAFWGLGFVLIAWISFARGEDPSAAQITLLIFVTVWGARLAIHIAWRNHGEGEDRRYQAMRRARGPSFWWQSLFRIFWLQGFLMLIIAAPLVMALGSARSGWRWTDGVGVGLWLIGFGFEAVGDAQLVRFKRQAQRQGGVLDRGLWRYSRHPNYFGEAVLWWGFFAFALGVPGGTWTVLSPVLMTVLLLKVSGVALLEKDIAERRPAYRSYIERTNAFLPWFPRRVPKRTA